jgi:tetratricopeptide (TPR) repeat protein
MQPFNISNCLIFGILVKTKSTLFLLLSLFSASLVYAESNPQIDSFRQIFQSSQDISVKLEAGHQLTRLFVRSNHDSAVYYGQKCYELGVDEGSKKELGIAHSDLGNVYFYSNEYEKSMSHYGQSNQLFLEIEFWKGIGVNKSTEAIYYNRIGQNDKAVEISLESLKILREHGGRTDVGAPLTTLGIVYMREGDYDLASQYLEEALALYTDSTKTASLLNNLGLIFYKKKEFHTAISYFERTLFLDSLQHNLGGMSSTYSNLAVCYKNLEMYDTAMSFNVLSLKIDYKLNSRRGVAASMNNIGAILLRKEKYTAARDTFLKGLLITEELGDKGITRDILTNLSDAYFGLNQFDSALFYYKKFKILGDSIFTSDRRDKINELQRGYALDAQNHKIMLLDSKLAREKQLIYFVIALGLVLLVLMAVVYNRFRVKQKLSFKMQRLEYEQKMVQLQMNPHFIFNALASISSYIGIEEKDKAIRYLSKFAKLIRARLENGRKSSISVDDELENLRNYLDLEQIRLDNPFEYSMIIASDVKGSQEIPPTLLQPFLENAILHGFENSSSDNSLKIHLFSKDQKLVAEITDNGIGRKESLARQQKQKNLHQSLSTIIISEYYSNRNVNQKTKLNLSFVDLTDDERNSTGTKVIIDLCFLNDEL